MIDRGIVNRSGIGFGGGGGGESYPTVYRLPRSAYPNTAFSILNCDKRVILDTVAADITFKILNTIRYLHVKVVIVSSGHPPLYGLRFQYTFRGTSLHIGRTTR